jgi:hypothetical protein
LAEMWKTNMEVNEIPYANCAIFSSLLRVSMLASLYR